MKIGLSLPYYKVSGFNRERILAWARKIDRGPFDSLISSERVTDDTYEMHTLLSAAAAVTERVKIMPALYVLPMRSAVLTAKEIATLDIIADGRVAVTVGVGGRAEDYRALDASFEHRHERMDAQVNVMRKVWRGEALFEGAGKIGPSSPQGADIKIFAGAMGPKSIARAAQWADGIYGASVLGDREGHARIFEMARAAWKQAGRDAPPYLIGGFWYSLAPDARDALKDYAYNYMRSNNEEMARGLASAMTRYTPQAIMEGIENVRIAGANEVVLIPTTAHDNEIDQIVELLT